MIDAHRTPSHAFFMRRIAAVIAGGALLTAGVLRAQTTPSSSDNPMAGLNIDGTNAAPVKPDASVASMAPQSFLEKFKGHLIVFKDSHLQPADAGALDGVKYITLLYENGELKEGRQFMQNVLPFYYALKRKHPDYEMIFVDGMDSADEMEHFVTSYKMPWLIVRSDDAKSDTLNLWRYNADEYMPDLILFDNTGKILSDSVVNGNWVGLETVMQDTEKILPEPSETP